MPESRYVRTGRADLIARIEAIDLAIARIRDRLAMCRRNRQAVRDEIDDARILARVETYELVLAELEGPKRVTVRSLFVCGHYTDRDDLPLCPVCGQVRVNP